MLGVGVVLALLLREEPYVAPPPGPTTADQVRPAAAARTLDALARAWERGDEDAAGELAAGAPARRVLTAAARTARQARITGIGLRYVTEEGGVRADGSWTAAVTLTWQFAGLDPHPMSTEVSVGLAPAGAEGVRVTGLGAGESSGEGDDGQDALGGGTAGVSVGGGRLPLWLSGPLQVRRGPDSVVLVAGTAAEADRYARLARVAVPAVRDVESDWGTGLVVEVPASAGALARTLGVGDAVYAGIAAVTTAPDGSLSATATAHVFVNPDVLGPLSATGQQIVMTHEATHVATDAANSGAEPWVVEGFADWVALRDEPVPVRVSAAQVIAEVREDGVPETLPSREQLATTAAHLGAAYEAAWLVCTVLADGGDPGSGRDADRLVSFYDEVVAGADVDVTLEKVFGISQADLLARWQERLRQLAG